MSVGYNNLALSLGFDSSALSKPYACPHGDTEYTGPLAAAIGAFTSTTSPTVHHAVSFLDTLVLHATGERLRPDHPVIASKRLLRDTMQTLRFSILRAIRHIAGGHDDFLGHDADAVMLGVTSRGLSDRPGFELLHVRLILTARDEGLRCAGVCNPTVDLFGRLILTAEMRAREFGVTLDPAKVFDHCVVRTMYAMYGRTETHALDVMKRAFATLDYEHAFRRIMARTLPIRMPRQGWPGRK